MIQNDKMRPFHGTLNLTAYDQNGCKLWQMKESNQIVTDAYSITAGALAGDPSTKISKVAAGTDATPPVEGDTRISDATVVDIQTVDYPRPGVVIFNFTFGYHDGVGKTICEFGLLSADGRLFARKVRASIEKTKYMSIVGAWEITI